MQTAKVIEKLTLLKLNVSRGDLGEPLEFWEPLQVLYGSILNERGSKNFSNLPGDVYTTTLRFWLRYNPMINKKGMKVEYNEEKYKVLEVTHISPRQATIILIEAVQ